MVFGGPKKMGNPCDNFEPERYLETYQKSTASSTSISGTSQSTTRMSHFDYDNCIEPEKPFSLDLIELGQIDLKKKSLYSVETSSVSSLSTVRTEGDRDSEGGIDRWIPLKPTMLSSKPTKADLDHKFDYEDSLKSSDSNMAFRLQHSSPVSKREYIQQWQGELPDEKPAEKPEGNQLCLYRELKDLKEQIRFLNTYTDRLLSSVCTTSIVRCLNRLCGLFSPTWEFYSVLNDLSKVTGTKRPQDWLHDTNLLDTAIAKCLRVTLNQYDDVNPIDINLDLNIDNNSERLERFTPPDVLWVLIQTCDYHILSSLESNIELSLKITRKLTQRYIILLVLLNRIRYPTKGESEVSRDSGNFQFWAKHQAMMFTQNYWLLNRYQTCSGRNSKISLDDIKLVISKETKRLDSCIRKRKRSLSSNEEAHRWQERESCISNRSLSNNQEDIDVDIDRYNKKSKRL